jgi:hypothetical protein
MTPEQKRAAQEYRDSASKPAVPNGGAMLRDPARPPKARWRAGYWITAIVVVVLVMLAASQITIFVVQPIGAVPEGRTLIIVRLNKTTFIDSADALCERLQGRVTLMCRMAMMAGVMNKTTIIARLPYSETLYLMSTGGKRYEKLRVSGGIPGSRMSGRNGRYEVIKAAHGLRKCGSADG